MIYLSLGSNLGDRLENLKTAQEELSYISTIKAVSKIYESEALVKEDAPKEWRDLPYLNMVVGCETHTDIKFFYWQTSQIERQMGRKREGQNQWDPRFIDIDVIAEDDKIYNLPNLIVPHKLMHTRNFVLLPMADINKKWQYPVKNHKHYGKTVCEILAEVGVDGIKIFEE